MRGFSRITTEVGLSILMLGTPLALGGVHKPTIMVACFIACLSLLSLYCYRRSTKRKLRVPWFGLLLMALTAYTAFQMVPIPRKLLKLMAPATLQVLQTSLAGIPGATGWHSISLDPASTFWEVLKLGTCTVAFIVAHNFLYRHSRRNRILYLMVGGGVLLTILGFVGAVVAPHKPLLFYTPTPGGGMGMITTSFVNPNHGAAYLCLGAIVSVGMALAARDLQQRVLLVVSAVLLGTGVFLTLSRGGILALAVALVTLTLLQQMVRSMTRRARTSTPTYFASIFRLHFRRTHYTRLTSGMAIIPAVVALILVASIWLAYSEVTREFSHMLPSGSADWSKTLIWPSGLAMVLANPFVGVGRGAFMTAFPRYLQVDLPHNVYSHMENQYIHLAAEWGIPVGIGIILASALALVGWIIKGHHGARTLAVASGLVALALHNVVDFNFELLGIALPAAILAGFLSAGVNNKRLEGLTAKAVPTSFKTLRAVMALSFGAALLLLGIYAIFAGPPDPWEDDARLAAMVHKKVSLLEYRKAVHQALRRHPSDYIPHLAQARYAATRGKAEALASLNRAMFLFPRSPQIHLEAARILRRFGRRRQALLEYRLTLRYGARARPVLREAFSLVRTTSDLSVLLPANPSVQAEAVALLLRKGRGKGAAKRAAARVKLAHSMIDRMRRDWPRHHGIKVASVEVLLAMGRSTEARLAAEELVQRHSSPMTYDLLARAAGRDKGIKAELAVWARARQRFPNHLNTGFNLSRAHVKAREFDEAIAVVKEIQDHSHSTRVLIQTHGLMAHIFKLSGSPHRAQYHAKQVLRLKGNR